VNIVNTTDIEDLKRTIESLQKENQTQANTINKLNVENAALLEDNKTLKAHIESLQKRNLEQEKRISILEQQVKDLKETKKP